MGVYDLNLKLNICDSFGFKRSGGILAGFARRDFLPVEAGVFYVMDRGYPDFARL